MSSLYNMGRALLQLMLAKGIGNAAIKKILKDIKNNSDRLYEDYCKDSVLLQSVLYRPGNVSEVQHSIAANIETAERLSSKLDNQGIVVITEIDDDYPEKLKKKLGRDCPPVLFLKGNIDLLNSCSVGFCGSRKVSEKGAVITDQCARQLVNSNITVVSGYAGGTFAAGEESLKRKLPLFVVDYAKPEVSAEANPYFIENGGNPIRSRGGLPNIDAVIGLPDNDDNAGEENGGQLSMF